MSTQVSLKSFLCYSFRENVEKYVIKVKKTKNCARVTRRYLQIFINSKNDGQNVSSVAKDGTRNLNLDAGSINMPKCQRTD